MSAHLNRATIIGYLGADPEFKELKEGQKVANFRVATTRTVTKEDGEKVDYTEWHSVEAWGPQAEVAKNYLKKGSQVFVEGSLRTRESKSEEKGTTYYNTSIVSDNFQMLGKKPD